MHFFFGVGAFFTPIIVKSFLNSDFDITITSNSFNCYNIEEVKYKNYFTETYLKSDQSHFKLSMLNDTVTRGNAIVPNILMTRTQFTSQTKYAFWILALIQLPAPLFLFVFMNRFDNLTNDTQLSSDEPKNESDLNEAADSFFSADFFKSLFNNIPVLQMTLLISFLVFLFEGLQVLDL